jgi:integrative and conjugative element protein (TIGR02256 family)
MSWDQDTIVHDKRSGFEIRIAAGAWEAMTHAANVADMTQLEGLRSETGGSLFGQIDEASMVAWITAASGMLEGSATSPAAILLSTGADRNHSEELFRQSRGAVSFVGLWHSHPNSEAEPSPTDLRTMEELTAPAPPERPRPLLLLILGSGCGRWKDYLMYGERPELHAQLFFGGSQRRP